jgi:hypothetical protein
MSYCSRNYLRKLIKSIYKKIQMQRMSQTGTDPGFVRPEAYTILGALFKKKNAKLGTKVNIYLGCLGCASERP